MITRLSIHNVFLALVSLLATGCLGTRYLNEGEYLRYEQKVKGTQRRNEGELADV